MSGDSAKQRDEMRQRLGKIRARWDELHAKEKRLWAKLEAIEEEMRALSIEHTELLPRYNARCIEANLSKPPLFDQEAGS